MMVVLGRIALVLLAAVSVAVMFWVAANMPVPQ